MSLRHKYQPVHICGGYEAVFAASLFIFDTWTEALHFSPPQIPENFEGALLTLTLPIFTERRGQQLACFETTTAFGIWRNFALCSFNKPTSCHYFHYSVQTQISYLDITESPWQFISLICQGLEMSALEISAIPPMQWSLLFCGALSSKKNSNISLQKSWYSYCQ